MGKESEAVLCDTEQMFKCNKYNGRPQTQIRLYRKNIYIDLDFSVDLILLFISKSYMYNILFILLQTSFYALPALFPP